MIYNYLYPDNDKNKRPKFTTKSVSYIETFLSFEDASTWIEGHLRDIDHVNFALEQCSINLINNQYRAGIAYTKTQLELDLDERA